jgi:hypothetical protein
MTLEIDLTQGRHLFLPDNCFNSCTKGENIFMNAFPLASGRNAADDAFSSRPKGAPQKTQSCVTTFVKGAAINCRLRLDLNLLGGS